MQQTCIYLCATLAQDRFDSIGWCIGIGDFWGESLFEEIAGKGEMRCGDFIGVQKMPTKKRAGSGLPSKHHCMAIQGYCMTYLHI
jgi:hypothetical protein